MNEIQQLKNEVAVLKREIAALKQSATIPIEIEQALERRDFISTGDVQNPPSGAEIAGMGFKEEIALTGNAQTITVFAEPTKYLRIKNKNYGGTAIYIPVLFL